MKTEENFRKRRDELIKEYKEISKKISRKPILTKEQALNRDYLILADSYNRKLQGRLRLPISLIGIKVRLTEVK